jgi:LPXTG-motif cell wall-anchored protein
MPIRFWCVLLAGLVISALGGSVATAHARQTAGSLPPEMLNTTWQLVSLQPDGQAAQDVASSGITISFTPQSEFSGSGGCNSYSGSYAAPGGQALTIQQPFAVTQMFCADPAGTLERLYFAALGQVQRYTLESATRLVLELGGGGRLVYETATPSTLPATGRRGTSIEVLLGLALLLLAGGRWARRGQG